MIRFSQSLQDERDIYHHIILDEEGMEKMKLILGRALNTLSPTDPELIALLDALEGL